MRKLSEQWLRPAKARDTFPPYELADRDLVALSEERTRKLGRIYHVAHDQAWDGRKVLGGLIEKHGGIRFPEEKKEAFGRIASVLLWGELAAWSISADLALRLEDTDAKMAATSQVFDEARHFYVLRDYLWRAGIEVPRLGGYSRVVLVRLLETDNLLHKLVGMQLMVENTALALFKNVAAAEIEPVLSELLYYYERDEARHVGLGALTLPKVLPDLSQRDAFRLWAFQLQIQLFMVAGGLTLRRAFETLGIDQSAMQLQSFKLLADVHRRMQEASDGGGDGRRTRGLFKISRKGQARVNAFLFPEQAEGNGAWRQRTLSALVALAERGDRWLTERAPA